MREISAMAATGPVSFDMAATIGRKATQRFMRPASSTGLM